MTSTSSNGGSGRDISHLFHREGAVSVADLRVDVAGNVSRTVAEDETIRLETKTLHARGNYSIARASRTRQVDGDYERHVEEAETLMIGAAVDEQVNGGVDYTAQLDADHIIGGAYVNTIAGPYLRIAAWADFLCWGGWPGGGPCPHRSGWRDDPLLHVPRPCGRRARHRRQQASG